MVPISLRKKTLYRLAFAASAFLLIRTLFFPSSESGPSSRSFATSTHSNQIEEHNFIERATRPDKSLNVQKHKFLQARIGRDSRLEVLGDVIRNGINDYWDRFQLP